MFEITLMEESKVVKIYRSPVVPEQNDRLHLPEGNYFRVNTRFLSSIDVSVVVLQGKTYVN